MRSPSAAEAGVNGHQDGTNRSLGLSASAADDRSDFHRRGVDAWSSSHAKFGPDLRELVAFARTKLPIALLGETGAGKTALARAIHVTSGREREKFVVVEAGSVVPQLAASLLFGHSKGSFTDASANKRGKFEAADGGTLFIDDFDTLDRGVQASLLHAVESGKITSVGENHPKTVDVRIVVATNNNPDKLVEGGVLRADLWQRLQGFVVKIPPLRQRIGDLSSAVASILTYECQGLVDSVKSSLTISGEAMAVLESYSWPGNFRELRLVLQRAIVRSQGELIEPHHISLPDGSVEEGAGLRRARIKVPAHLPEWARGVIAVANEIPLDRGDDAANLLWVALMRRALAEKGTREAASKALGFSRITFYKNMTKLVPNLAAKGLDPELERE